MTGSGIVNLYDGNTGDLAKRLHGLDKDSFCLSWNKLTPGLLASAAGTSVCIWDVEVGKSDNKNVN
jgi:WD40 repeat protein